jgi:hypothetical protein
MTLIRRSRDNVSALSQISNSLFVVCLDQTSDVTMIHRETINRWHLSSLQIVVNDKSAAIIASFPCGLDGNTMGRFAAELVKRSQLLSQSTFKTNWNHINLNCSVTDQKISFNDESGISTIDGIGASRLTQMGLNPDAVFNVALITTIYRLLNVVPNVLEHVSLSSFRKMGVELAAITTPEVIRYAIYASSKEQDSKIETKLLKEAIDSHLKSIKTTRSRISLKTLSMLNVRTCQFWTCLQTWLLAMSIAGKPDIIVSQPKLHQEVLFVGRPGVRIPYVRYFGLHYQIHSDKISLVLMPSLTWKISQNLLFKELTFSIQKIINFTQ